MKQHTIDTLQPGETVSGVYLLSEKRTSQKRDGSPYLSLVLSDKTGTVNGVMWDPDTATARIQGGCPVRVQAAVSEYRGALQLVVRSMEEMPRESVDPADFLPSTAMDVEDLFERLRKLTGSIRTPWIGELFEAFWSDPSFVDRFKKAPAAKRMHHAYLGGLLVHCLSMAVLADKLAAHYSGIDRDLLIAGAVLHDIGKLEEFEYACRMDYTTRGRLLSHIVIGLEMIDEKLKAVADLPADQADLLRHMIVSHHGEREFGAVEPPKTLEAVLLHYIDEMDSKVNGIREFLAKEDPEEAWSSYHRLLGRHFFMPPSDGTEE